MDGERLFAQGLAAHARVTAGTAETLQGPFADLVAAASDTLDRAGKLLLFGNGGSAADAQHLAAELVGRFRHERPALPALALTTDSSVLTALGNDLGFGQVFARQVQALGRPGDLALGLSTSGRSANVVAGLQVARDRGLRTAALTGADGGDLAGLADTLLCVPSSDTARIQEMHILLGHLLCEALEKAEFRPR